MEINRKELIDAIIYITNKNKYLKNIDKNDIEECYKLYDIYIKTISKNFKEKFNRNIKICIDYYNNKSLRSVAEKYDLSISAISDITYKMARKFSIIYKSQISSTNSICHLNLHNRIYNCLYRAGFKYDTNINDLYKYNKDFYLGLRNFGEKSLIELNEALVQHGYSEIK